MKRSLYIMIMSASALLMSFNSPESTKENVSGEPQQIIGKCNPTIKDGLMTPEILYSFARVGDVKVSPDKSKIVYQVSYVSYEQNRTNPELFIMNIDGSGKKQLTESRFRESNPVWIENGKKIAYLSNESGSTQIWTMNPDGSGKQQISQIDGDVEGFSLSPDGTKVLYIQSVKVLDSTQDRYPDLQKTSGKIVDNLMYKHWDTWVTTAPHPFVADIKGGKIGNGIDLLKGEPYESPMLPWGGIEQLAWSPDNKTIAYVSRKKTGKEYSISTNSDIYFYNVATGETKNMTEGMMGYDNNPVFSPDGKYLLWNSMERDGYEADKLRLFMMDIATGKKTYITENFDYNADSYIFTPDSKKIYMISTFEAKMQVYEVDPFKKTIKPVAQGPYDYTSVELANNGKLIAKRHSLSKPDEIYSVDIKTGNATELSFVNKEILDKLTMGKVEERWIPTTDGKKMLTWVVFPPNFDPNKKYPALLYCQGGPQSAVSQFWSYRWNLQMMAANGYIVVAPNRRGLPGFGQEWLEQISGDYGGQNMKDYLSAIDAVSKEPYVDSERLGCTGASYGGFSTYWLAGHHNKRFKAFLAHAGIFNLEAQYLETEELWFANWDMGGNYWDKSNKIAQNTYANSPHLFVDKWDTPIMITVGELDYRILASQGMMAFNAAQLRNIPSRMLVFPDENHWVSQPQNGMLFQREFFRWFDHWLKK